MLSSGNRVFLGVFTALLLATGASPSFAGTTGRLAGQVLGEDGSALAGVTVSVSSPVQIGGLLATTTDPDGQFRYLRLTPGVYTVRAEHGETGLDLSEVQIRLDRLTELRITLPMARFAGETEVLGASPVVDPEQVSTGQSYTQEYMRETSSNWRQLVQQTPGTSPTDDKWILGTVLDNSYRVDGLDATDWRSHFPSPAALQLPFDALQEVAVHTSSFEAEYGQATGGVVNLLTRSGGNRFAGTLDIRYAGNDFESTGEHYDPDIQDSERRDLALTLGGPIFRDRLWFFATYRDLAAKSTPNGAQTTLEQEEGVSLLKLSWRPSPGWSIVGSYSGTPWETANLGSSELMAPEATSHAVDDSWMASVEAVRTIGARGLWTGRVGQRTWDEAIVPTSGDLHTIAHANESTGESTANAPSQFYADSRQENVETDLTWFAGGPLGSHEIKGGALYGRPRFDRDLCLNGAGRCQAGVDTFMFHDLDGPDGEVAPYLLRVVRSPGPTTYGADVYALYVQDTWRLHPEVTVKAGLRWDGVTYENGQGETADLEEIQPRLGAAWDLTGDSRTILRGSWGRFMHPGNATFPLMSSESSLRTEYWLSCSSFVSADPDICADTAAELGQGYRQDPDGWDPAGWFLEPGLVFGAEPTRVAPGLEPGVSEQWMLGVEREIFRRTSVELGYIRKEGSNFPEDTCNGNVPQPQQGAACDHYVIVNIPEARVDWDGWLFRFESRASELFHVLASWVVSESQSSVQWTTGVTPTFDVYPYHWENRYGYNVDHSDHRVKVDGYLRLPWEITVAAHGWWQSGFRWTPATRRFEDMPYGLYHLEPRGSRQGPGSHQIDLQVAKGLALRGVRLELLGTVRNLMDRESPMGACSVVTGCGRFAMGDANSWQQPRRYEAGLRVEF